MTVDRGPAPEWAQAEEASPFTPPASSATPTILIAVAIVAVGVAGALGYRSWTQDRTWAKPVPEPVIARMVQPPEALRAEAVQKARRAEQFGQALRAKNWTRCQVGEQVVYSDSGCGAGVAQRNSANTQAPISAIPSMPETPASHTLYRCKPYSGGVFWSTRHCNQQQALVDRMVTVPRNMTLNQKIAIAERSLKREALVVRRAPMLVPQRPAALTDKQKECNALDEVIRDIDAEARMPLSGQRQDWLRAERTEARDRQFELRCGRG